MSKLTFRKIINFLALSLCVIFTLIVMFPLFSLLGYVISKGIQVINLDFFINLPAPAGEYGGGLGNAVLGTIYMVGIAVIFALPIGILNGIYLSEFGSEKLAKAVRFLSDVLTGVPSIVVGIFVYIILVKTLRTFSAFAGGVALAIIMIPIVIRTTEEMLRLVPNTLREASLALGATSWRTTVSVVLPSAARGIVTGIMLAVARVAGETAPLLFTALNSRYWPGDLFATTASLPVYIFTYAISPYASWQDLAWAGAFVLISMILLVNLFAKLVSSRFVQMRGE